MVDKGINKGRRGDKTVGGRGRGGIKGRKKGEDGSSSKKVAQ